MAQPTLPPGYHRAPVSDDIVGEAAAHFVGVVLGQYGRPLISEADYKHYWTSPLVDPQEDLCVVRDDDGRIAAQEVVVSMEPHVNPTVVGVVSPEHCNRGLGTALVDWATSRALEKTSSAPDDLRVVMNVLTDPSHGPSVDLLENLGFEVDRYFITMEIEFDGAPPAAGFPDGFALRPMTADTLEAGLHAVRDAFRDHYGYVERPFDQHLQQIAHLCTQPDHDPSLWWLLYEGDEIVANCWCNANAQGDPTMGYVLSLGVRRPWRRRGLARTLLLHAFAEFHARGYRGAALDVDAHSLTGATRLYEAAGMIDPTNKPVAVPEEVG